ncbi:MAG: hypothetical protein NTX25_07365 [Proteobacteria bacterium]|nr:hypothetical protein [Pseudomonadota bacterium]
MQSLATHCKKSRIAKNVMFAGLFILFLPFGILIGIGWLLPRTIEALGALKDFI